MAIRKEHLIFRAQDWKGQLYAELIVNCSQIFIFVFHCTEASYITFFCIHGGLVTASPTDQYPTPNFVGLCKVIRGRECRNNHTTTVARGKKKGNSPLSTGILSWHTTKFSELILNINVLNLVVKGTTEVNWSHKTPCGKCHCICNLHHYLQYIPSSNYSKCLWTHFNHTLTVFRSNQVDHRLDLYGKQGAWVQS